MKNLSKSASMLDSINDSRRLESGDQLVFNTIDDGYGEVVEGRSFSTEWNGDDPDECPEQDYDFLDDDYYNEYMSDCDRELIDTRTEIQRIVDTHRCCLNDDLPF